VAATQNGVHPLIDYLLTGYRPSFLASTRSSSGHCSLKELVLIED